jgi:hypothetical protein
MQAMTDEKPVKLGPNAQLLLDVDVESREAMMSHEAGHRDVAELAGEVFRLRGRVARLEDAVKRLLDWKDGRVWRECD